MTRARPRVGAQSVLRHLPWLLCFTIFFALSALLVGSLAMGTPQAAAQAAPFPQDSSANLPDPQIGLAIYSQKCAACHGDSGMGNGPQAAQLQFPPTQFADALTMRQLAPSTMFSVTKLGRIERFMPPFGGSTADPDIWNVVAYAWSLHLAPEDLRSGEALYQANCAACHGDTGQGDGPDATADVPDLSSLAMTAAQSQRAWFDALAATSTTTHASAAALSDEERWSVLEYVRSFTLPPFEVREFEPGPGVIAGQIVNGTAGQPSPAGLPVVLRVFDQFSLAEEITTTTSPSGTFAFENLSTESGWIYVAGLEYAGVPYSTDILTLTADLPARETPVTVYEAGSDPSAIAVERMHWFVEFDQDQLLVAELYFWSNDSDTVYVGTPSGAVLSYTLPAGQQDLSIDGGEIGGRFQATPEGLVDTLPLPPGQGSRQMLLRYTLPYQAGASLNVTRTLPVPVRNLNVLVADAGEQLQVPGLQENPPRQVEGASYFNYSGTNLAAGQPVALAFSDLPALVDSTAAGEASAAVANTPWLGIGLAAAGGLVLLGVVAYALRRRPDGEGDEESILEEELLTADELQRRRQRLLRAIAQLDDTYAAGGVPADVYQSRRAELKADLLAVAEALQELDELAA